jgi:hypothetical protein
MPELDSTKNHKSCIKCTCMPELQPTKNYKHYARARACQKPQVLCQSSSLPKTTSPMPELEATKNHMSTKKHKPYARHWFFQKPQVLCQSSRLPKTTSPMPELEPTKIWFRLMINCSKFAWANRKKHLLMCILG